MGVLTELIIGSAAVIIFALVIMLLWGTKTERDKSKNRRA
jgi:hypothetical protein